MYTARMAKDFYIIDGHAHIYAAHFAPMRAKLTSPSGEPTKATYIFTTALLGLIQRKSPDMLVVAMDSKAPTFRSEIYPQYKANRPPMPEELPGQIERIEEILAAMRIPMLRCEGYEADDVIGSLARKAESAGHNVFICSRDKDLIQLIDEHTAMYDIKNDSMYGLAELNADKGVSPNQFVDVLALMGDTSDNVPGVPDVGPKTALDWIRKYGSLDGLYEHADEIKGKRGSSLRDNKEQAYLSQRLVTIETNSPIELDLDSFAFKDPDLEKVGEIFRELDFSRLLSQLGIKDSAAKSPQKEKADKGGADIAPPETVGGLDTVKTIKPNYELVDDEPKLDSLVKKLTSRELFAIDTETTGFDAMQAELVGISLSFEQRSAYYIPVRAPLGCSALPISLVREKLGPILADAGVKKVGQNIKYDMLILENAGLGLKGVYFDTMVASYCLHADRRHSMDMMAKDFLHYETIPISALIGKGKNQLTFDMVDTAAACDYACEDADITLRLYHYFEKRLRSQPDINKLFQALEMPLVSVLAKMELNGVSLDTGLLREMSTEIGRRLDELIEKIHDCAGRVFNIDSPKQLAEVLFDGIGLQSVRSGKTTRSTDAAVLEQLEGQHEIIPLLIDYRQLVKLKNTYLDKLPKLINPKTNRLHASFNQTVTATGRLSSSDPNLQNIPIRTELGRKIRAAFVPENKDGCILSADYSQIELRLLAHLSRDPELIKAFDEDRDIHRFVASQIYEVPIEQVTSQMRSNCKAVNFGIIYGQGPFGLSRTIGIPQHQAKKFIEDYFARYSAIRAFMDSVIEKARKNGFAETIMGRRRDIKGLDSRNFNTRSSAERMAVNTTIQGSAADLIKAAMINIQRRIDSDRLDVKMILQIHDELVFEMAKKDAENHRDWIVKEMTGAIKLDVPLKVDAEVGPSWLTDK